MVIRERGKSWVIPNSKVFDAFNNSGLSLLTLSNQRGDQVMIDLRKPLTSEERAIVERLSPKLKAAVNEVDKNN